MPSQSSNVETPVEDTQISTEIPTEALFTYIDVKVRFVSFTNSAGLDRASGMT
jgi:hypothetical protein